MKKVLLTVFFCTVALFAFAVVASAQGEKVADIYSTDILTYVNDEPMEGFNIGGKTCVIAEDLADKGYGYAYSYNDETRHLALETVYGIYIGGHPALPRGNVGEIVGAVYSSDISVTVNGLPITGYNIGGKTAICIEELGESSGIFADNCGYSGYLHYYFWNDSERTITLYSFLDNSNAILGLNVARISYTYCNDTLYLHPDAEEVYASVQPSIAGELQKAGGEGAYSFYYTEDFSEQKYKVTPLYVYDNVTNNKAKMGYRVAVYDAEAEVDRTYLKFDDIELMDYIVREARTPQKSYDEAIAYVTETCDVVKEIENGTYKVFLTKREDGNYAVYTVKKSGGVLLSRVLPAEKTVDIFWGESENECIVSEYPFADAHGNTTTMHSHFNLDEYDFS